jgi:hypothetical protein
MPCWCKIHTQAYRYNARVKLWFVSIHENEHNKAGLQQGWLSSVSLDVLNATCTPWMDEKCKTNESPEMDMEDTKPAKDFPYLEGTALRHN